MYVCAIIIIGLAFNFKSSLTVKYKDEHDTMANIKITAQTLP